MSPSMHSRYQSLGKSLAGMFEEINDGNGASKRERPEAVKALVGDDRQLNRMEEKAHEILQRAYTGYLHHELPDQGKAPYQWDESFDGIVTHLYPQDRVVLVPAREENQDILRTPVFRQRMCVFPFTKQMVAEYLKAKTGDEFITKTEWYQNMPEQMTLIDLIRYLGNLGQELGDFSLSVLAKNGQARFSIAPHTLALSLPPERRIIYALIVEQGVRTGDITFNADRRHFDGVDTQDYRRLEDRFALFKRNLRSALPGDIKIVNEVLKRNNLPNGLGEVIASLEMITTAHTKPWRELVDARRVAFEAQQREDRRRAEAEHRKRSKIIKAEDFDEYFKGLRSQGEGK